MRTDKPFDHTHPVARYLLAVKRRDDHEKRLCQAQMRPLPCGFVFKTFRRLDED